MDANSIQSKKEHEGEGIKKHKLRLLNQLAYLAAILEDS
jgi:hypothetical protein